MKTKILLLFIIGFFIFITDVSAGMCDSEHISQLKELANQVDISYEYLDYSNSMNGGVEGEFVTNTYLVSVNLLSDELYLIDEFNNVYNFDGKVIQLVLNSGEANFSIHSKKCLGYKLRSVSLALPKFNLYSYREECAKLSNFDLEVCDPWYQGKITDDIFNETVEKYIKVDSGDIKKSNVLLEFFKRYYLWVVGIIILVTVIIISIVKFKKRSVLE